MSTSKTKQSNNSLFSPETSSIKDFLNNFETKIIPQGHEKAFKQSLYNALALLFILLCGITCYGVYLILDPFLKPLLWALICGTVLHPAKKAISNYLKKYVQSMESYSMVIQAVYVPILVVDSISDLIGTKVQYICNVKYIFPSLGAGLSVVFIYMYLPSILLPFSYLFSFSFSLINITINILQHLSVIILLCIAYITWIFIFYSKNSSVSTTKNENVQNTPNSKEKEGFILNEDDLTKVFSIFVWFSISCYLSSFCGSYIQPVILVFIVFIFVLGFVYQHYYYSEDSDVVGEPNQSFVENKSESSIEGIEKSNKKMTKRSMSDPNILNNSPTRIQSPGGSSFQSNTEVDSPIDHSSDSYIYWVLCCCVVTAIFNNLYLICIFILFEIIFILKKIFLKFRLRDHANEKINSFNLVVKDWFSKRQDAIFPAPLNGIRKLNILWRHTCLSLFKDSSEAIASVIVILTLLFIMVFSTLFFVVQCYAETFYMVKVGGNIINQTLVHNPELLKFLPEDYENQLDSLLNNTYTYGRVAISKMVFGALEGVKKEKVLEFEKTALELWDRIYQAWLMSAVESSNSNVGPKVSPEAVSQTWTTFIEHIQKTPELMNSKAIFALLNNMTMLSSGLESVWLLMKTNIELVMQALTTLLSLVFGSGFALLNFIINIVIFLTALFYLLSSSGRLYKPVQIITSVSPVYGNKVAVAIENAVHEVLTASFKLALFYGLWTWLIHSLFQVQLVYIPSAIASILAAVPVLGPYWACVPGVLDLYFAQDSGLKALCLVTFQVLPTFFVDTAIFNEIQGGHPYLTGLSVAGGVFWLGMEGAIIGPLLLCCLFVIVKLSTSIMKEHEHTSPVNQKYRR